MIERLFPPDIVTVVATAEMWDEELHPEEEPLVRNAVKKRRREFAAGRSCARKALQTLGFESYPLLSGSHREPLWPPGIIGSLTHCEGYCAAVVARTDRIAGLGVDAEVSEALDPELIRMVCTPAELEWVRGNRPPQHGDWPKIIFSAKESVYKCLFPFVRRVLDYREVEIEFHPPMGRFSARLLFDPPEALVGVPAASGRFKAEVEHIVTGVTIDPFPGS